MSEGARALETTQAQAEHYEAATTTRSGFWALTLGSMGVVYGDIGTSPLYAVREAVTAATSGGGDTADAVLGVVSLILWALTIIVTLKYAVVLLHADNNGEGGTLALMALAQRVGGRWGETVAALGIIGAALFFGDALITPAISVLSAIEGLKVVTPTFEPFVVPNDHDSGVAVHRAIARHRTRGGILRTGDCRMVCGDCHTGRVRHCG